MRRFRITEPMNLEGDPPSINGRSRRKSQVSEAHPKREMIAMIARTTPATIRPILAPDVILTWLSFKRSGRVSTASGRDEDKHEKKVRETSGDEWLTVDEPEECTSPKSTTDEGQQRGNKDGGPDWNAATEMSAGSHCFVLVKNSLVRWRVKDRGEVR